MFYCTFQTNVFRKGWGRLNVAKIIAREGIVSTSTLGITESTLIRLQDNTKVNRRFKSPPRQYVKKPDIRINNQRNHSCFWSWRQQLCFSLVLAWSQHSFVCFTVKSMHSAKNSSKLRIGINVLWTVLVELKPSPAYFFQRNLLQAMHNWEKRWRIQQWKISAPTWLVWLSFLWNRSRRICQYTVRLVSQSLFKRLACLISFAARIAFYFKSFNIAELNNTVRFYLSILNNNSVHCQHKKPSGLCQAKWN